MQVDGAVISQGIHDAHRLYEISREDKIDFNPAYVGADFVAPHVQELDSAYLKKLFDYGCGLAVAGKQRHKSPPEE